MRPGSLLRLAPLALGLAALAGLLAWLARAVDVRALGQALAQARPGPLLLMALLALAFTLTRALRLHVVLQHRGAPLRTIHISNIGAMLNCLLPLRAGEVGMSLLLGPNLPRGCSEALSRLFVDRLLDTIAVLAVLAAALPQLGPGQQDITPGRALLFGAGGAAGLILAAWGLCAQEARVLRCAGALARLLRRDQGAWARRAEGMLEGLRSLFHSRVLLLAGGLSLLAWSLLALAFQAGMSALFPPPNPGCALLAVGMTVLGLMVAPMPAGIGTTHGAIVLALGSFGVGVEQALAFAILYHAVSTAISLLLGLIGLWSLRVAPGPLLRALWSPRPPDP